MRLKINCTLQGNYYSKIQQSKAIKFFSNLSMSSEETGDSIKETSFSKDKYKITKLLMQDFSDMLTLKPSH